MTPDVRSAYLNAGYSRRGFARAMSVNEATVRRLEDGKPIHPGSAKKIADFMGVKVTDLMPLDAEPAHHPDGTVAA